MSAARLSHCLFDDVCVVKLREGAIIHLDYAGFDRDYLVLHCLLRHFVPERVMEVGTEKGRGTKIIKNAVGTNATVFSLDLQEDVGPKIGTEFPAGKVGSLCDLPYIQLRGDSRTFDFSPYHPLQAWYVDAEHVYPNVLAETRAALGAGAKLVVYHDSDADEVLRGIVDGFADTNHHLWRVDDTRELFALDPEWDKPWWKETT